MTSGLFSFPISRLVSVGAGIFGFLLTLSSGLSAQDSATWAVTTFAGQAGTAGADDGLGTSAHFNGPRGIASDSAGNLYIADTFNHTIRKITTGGQVSTVAGAPGQQGFVDGNSSNARFNLPTGLAVDASGNIYVADFLNNAIRRITPDGTVSTIAGAGPATPGSADGSGSAAQFNQPAGLTVDSSGNLFVADSGNSALRKIDSTHTVTTIGGPAGSGQFNSPYGVAIDASGTIYVADTFNYVIRAVTAAGVVSTPAGSEGISGSVDGAGAAARFSGPSAITVSSTGTIFLTESGDDVRSITSSTVTTIAGTSGASGALDGSGNIALFSGPQGVTVTSDGTVFVCDTLNSTIRKLVHAQSNPTPSPTRFSNISTRSFVGTGDNVLIAGFVIGGSASKQVLIRASGPALIAQGLPDALVDPTLELHDANHGNAVIATNDDWSADPTNAAAVTQANKVTGTTWTVGSKDSAVVETLSPGAYTAIVSGKNGGTGIALIEVFELDNGALARLINISTRSRVQTGDGVQIAGFIVSGTSPKKVLIRAGGPFLNQYGISSAETLVDPTLELHDSNTVIGRNDDWSSDSTQAAIIQQATQASGAVSYAAGSKDAALVMTLNPGSYTAIVSGKNNGQGIALIEVDEIP